jgi:GntR family transcriptional regulator, transcriptional repressor for pyruvate dehydrogenase complex
LFFLHSDDPMGYKLDRKSVNTFHLDGMTDFLPIKQTRLSEAVTEQLKQSILRGDFEPGTKLPSERILAEKFQVSRLSVREAIHRLEILGFVRNRSGKNGGVFVIDLTFQSLSNGFSDLFLAGKISVPELRQLRVFIEPEVARLAALQGSTEDKDRLKLAYEREFQPIPDGPAGFDARAAVHYALAHMCGNRFYEGIVRSTLELTLKYLTIVDIDHEDFWVLHPTEAHHPIVEAVLAGDEERAHTAMKTHALTFGEVLLRLEEVYRKKRPEIPSRIPQGSTE